MIAAVARQSGSGALYAPKAANIFNHASYSHLTPLNGLLVAGGFLPGVSRHA